MPPSARRIRASERALPATEPARKTVVHLVALAAGLARIRTGPVELVAAGKALQYRGRIGVGHRVVLAACTGTPDIAHRGGRLVVQVVGHALGVPTRFVFERAAYALEQDVLARRVRDIQIVLWADRSGTLGTGYRKDVLGCGGGDGEVSFGGRQAQGHPGAAYHVERQAFRPFRRGVDGQRPAFAVIVRGAQGFLHLLACFDMLFLRVPAARSVAARCACALECCARQGRQRRSHRLAIGNINEEEGEDEEVVHG